MAKSNWLPRSKPSPFKASSMPHINDPAVLPLTRDNDNVKLFNLGKQKGAIKKANPTICFRGVSPDVSRIFTKSMGNAYKTM